MKQKKVLFLCTGNSCRSQMAEGFARHLFPESWEAHSAGTNPGRLDPLAVEVMKEAGVDISGHVPKNARDLLGVQFDLVVTVCDSAKEACPVFPGKARKVHHSFDDPPRLAREISDPAKALDVYRRVRDEIRDFVETQLKDDRTGTTDGHDGRGRVARVS